MDKGKIAMCDECITITKDRYKELLEYESFSLWVLNSIVIESLPNIELTKEKLKEISNDEKYKAIQCILQELLNKKGE